MRLTSHLTYAAPAAGSGLKSEVVQIVTEELRRKLQLTLFGYDIVVEDLTGDNHCFMVSHTRDLR